MGYPLDWLPTLQHDGITIESALDRGYYSATYVARQGFLNQRVCLKVIPKEIYALRGKDFLEECRAHAEVAEGTAHLVNIRDAFDADVQFPGDKDPLPCHVAVLEYVEGAPLRHVLEAEKLTARRTAQIAMDLLRLLQELDRKKVYHNDLHEGNIIVQQLAEDRERGMAIDPATRAVAVDMGSIRDESRSHEAQQIADGHQITRHLLQLGLRLVPDPVLAPDTEFRLALALNEIADLLKPDSLSQRAPNYEDLIKRIELSFAVASSPWKQPSEGLLRFGESYNAQTMQPWFVPRLLVDPGGEWQRKVEAPGPLIVTGMRGCGKTMLLRSVQLHARASLATEKSTAESLAFLKKDGYLGLYVSASRLLDGLGKPEGELHEPYARLFLCYAREALQALRHLSEVAGREAVSPIAPNPIATLIGQLIAGSNVRGNENIDVLERRIQEILRALESGSHNHPMSAHPVTAMPALAAAVTECAEVWGEARVLFLLDDVSTRHLHEESIRNLLSTLMFPHDKCAFKVTTEAQTLELVLKSPGLVEKARVGRDYESFDLAAEIHGKLRERSGRAAKEFVSEILGQRASLSPTHPSFLPQDLLGDQKLVNITRNIAESSVSSRHRKEVYHGISALAAVCVGDIGDVISIYELILTRAGVVEEVPIPPKSQSVAFQDVCSRRLFHLSRRGGRLKDFSDGFAAAAHQLLKQSAGKRRLRDYASIYVRITTGDVDWQLEQLRELTDAGVFVLTGGPDAPRTRTRDSDPVAQFTLTYRKLLGLSNFIGLSQRDRFELSGQNLLDWLARPEDSASILTRNLAGETDLGSAGGESRDDEEDAEDDGEPVDRKEDPSLFSFIDGQVQQEGPIQGGLEPTRSEVLDASNAVLSALSYPRIKAVPMEILKDVGLLVLGRGFEERALMSTQRILDVVTPRHSVLVSYALDGYGAQVEQAVRASRCQLTLLRDGEAAISDLQSGPALVDVTGLSKAYIYSFIRQLLLRDGTVYVAHTAAREHFPLQDDVRERLDRDFFNDYQRLEACVDILTGERKPYHFVPLHPLGVDDGRKRVLFASSSAKHERLFSLLQERDYDHVSIVVPPRGTPRSELARLAARVASHDYRSSSLVDVGSDDPNGLLETLSEEYGAYYQSENSNVEIGLTGSKLHCVALAAASVALKFAQAWYVRPDDFDLDRFTQGVGNTNVYKIDLV